MDYWKACDSVNNFKSLILAPVWYTAMAIRTHYSARLCGIALLCILITIPAAVATPDGDLSLSWTWSDNAQVPVGTRVSSVSLRLENQGKIRVRLEFVGVHFDWMEKDFYSYGSGSEKTNILEPGQSISYTIPFSIPENVKPGTYKCQAGLVYSTQQDATWNKVEIAHFSPKDFEVVAVKIFTVTSTTTISASSEDWAVDFALLIAFTSVGLALLATFRSSRRKQTEG